MFFIKDDVQKIFSNYEFVIVINEILAFGKQPFEAELP